MGVRYLYTTLNSGRVIADTDTFLREGKRHWPDCKTRSVGSADRETDVEILLDPDGASTIISHFSDGQLISVGGADLEEAADIAVWVRSFNPDPSLVLWFTTNVFDGHTVLTPGITSQQVIDQWVDHREHDPYAEYPEYLS
ncbi:hypothetical protein BKH13_13155 [Actinomyces naeslundii]|jgi:hypothetical protein|uniref:Uncharacterized protein n=1 Tax=Actinomyces naeslundii TaxID=1655 RepID=A0ABX3EVM3_ACTNA|nr:hypothetical protein [Actinomyces naeslundii]OLO80588.1 hypothetical protein BKH13_13155 [Actinomyces naeslundii]OLO81593.1 hypothetical protein BKH11_13435 [Actinomyces naeslundii]OLO82214.1 hypothetical protein BKH12_09865 [Actinomyces naeslundii]OLO91613.1 hypothetical protein BKH10_02210 [Actinomyces naeslundii]OMG08979.1 hypothetical protein BKH08_10260 [Actinomyces naeslundii]